MRTGSARSVTIAAGMCCLSLLTLGSEPVRQVETVPARGGTTAANVLPEKVVASHLLNVYRWHPKVISGGLPADESAFQELQKLGIKTVMSVDGATPAVELAKKYGMRYIHLPHGYDGIPVGRAAELAKAVRDLPGPIYIHCHHGKHRSPAAATVACAGAGLLLYSDAELMLKTAGTHPSYRGLYQSAVKAQRLDSKFLDELQVEFQEQVKVPPLAEAMVAMEHLHDQLKAMSQAQWNSPADYPDLTPAHETLLLREQFTELLRTKEVAQQPAGFQQFLLQSEQDLKQLEQIFLAGTPDHPLDNAQATALFHQITAQCNSCHQQFRDQPLGEKLIP